MRRLLLVYGLANAVLYCALMPIWEGFDELYHYGYVQWLAVSGSFPAVGNTRLSRELWTSLDFAPASHWVQPYFERPSTSFEEYFHLPEAERLERRKSLDNLDQRLQQETSPRENYEAKQSPLTYVLLAPIERALRGSAITLRVFTLRLLLSITSIVLLWMGMDKLGTRLGLDGSLGSASLFVLFCCQMVYATTCHVANDALLAPWLLFFLISQMDFRASPSLLRAAHSGLLMSIGLLLKSSTLVFVPMIFAAPLLELFGNRRTWRRAAAVAAVSAGVLATLAGPWYRRNLILYQNLSSTPETSGIGFGDLFRAARELPWRDSAGVTLHRGIWCGNNSFTTFSAFTVDIILLMLAVSAVLFVWRAGRSVNETLVVLSIALYSAGLAGITLAFFISSRGAVIAPMPWYTEILLGPVILFSFVGMGRWGRPGRWMAAASVLVWAYVAGATWLAKLVPLYGGFGDEHARPGRLWTWYVAESGQRDSILATLCPGPVWLIYLLLGVALITMVVLTVGLLSRLSPLDRTN